jgi:hypothetical protein
METIVVCESSYLEIQEYCFANPRTLVLFFTKFYSSVLQYCMINIDASVLEGINFL